MNKHILGCVYISCSTSESIVRVWPCYLRFNCNSRVINCENIITLLQHDVIETLTNGRFVLVITWSGGQLRIKGVDYRPSYLQFHCNRMVIHCENIIPLLQNEVIKMLTNGRFVPVIAWSGGQLWIKGVGLATLSSTATEG